MTVGVGVKRLALTLADCGTLGLTPNSHREICAPTSPTLRTYISITNKAARALQPLEQILRNPGSLPLARRAGNLGQPRAPLKHAGPRVTATLGSPSRPHVTFQRTDILSYAFRAYPLDDVVSQTPLGSTGFLETWVGVLAFKPRKNRSGQVAADKPLAKR